MDDECLTIQLGCFMISAHQLVHSLPNVHFPILLDLQFEPDQLVFASIEIMLMLHEELKDARLSVLVLIIGEKVSQSTRFPEARLLFEGAGLLLSPLDERLFSLFLAESIVLL